MRKFLSLLSFALVMATATTSCHHLDNHRLNISYVNVSFLTVADWNIYGVSGAAQYKEFNAAEKKPANFPYTAMSSTGVGGILLCTTYAAQPIAYDMACPVECRANIRVFVNEDSEAECPKCHSRYDIFEKFGHPISGPAAEKGYGLEIYNVAPGPMGEYMKISL